MPHPDTARPAVTLHDIREAARRIGPYVHRTPTLTSRAIDRLAGGRVLLKAENLQKVGAFKARGATNAIMALGDDEASRGVVTHSSGNHGQALAYAAAVRGIQCWVVMPDTAPAVKIDAVRGYGADVVLVPRPDREAAAHRIATEQGAVFIPPYNHPDVIAGQGTVALELIGDHPDIDVIYVPVGGGGLASGVAVVASAYGIPVVGVEPEGAADAAASLRSGELQPGVAEPTTICDGLLTGLGPLTFATLLATGVRIVTVSDAAVVAAGRAVMERVKVVVEPSGAAALAGALTESLAGRTAAVVVSGGNTDFRWLLA